MFVCLCCVVLLCVVCVIIIRVIISIVCVIMLVSIVCVPCCSYVFPCHVYYVVSYYDYPLLCVCFMCSLYIIIIVITISVFVCVLLIKHVLLFVLLLGPICASCLLFAFALLLLFWFSYFVLFRCS